MEPSQKKPPKRIPTVIFLKALLEAILEKLCSRFGFWSNFFVTNFRVIFQIAFGKPPARISEDFEVILKSVRSPFCILVCKCCKSAKMQPLPRETLVFEGAMFLFLHDFRNVFHVCFEGAVRMRFLSDFVRF